MKRWNYLRGILALFISLSVFPLSANARHLIPMDKKCQQESEKGSVRCLEWRAVRILSLSGGKKDEIKKAIDLLNQAHAIDPLNLSVLRNIAMCYIKMRDYKVALRYCDRALKIKPSFVEIKLLKCMLEERIGHLERCKECYRAVVQYYKDRHLTNDPNYVFAELMRGGPEAQRIKEDYLASLEPGSKSYKAWTKVFNNFDRDKFFYKLLP